MLPNIVYVNATQNKENLIYGGFGTNVSHALE
jgi:hypothetical protein